MSSDSSVLTTTLTYNYRLKSVFVQRGNLTYTIRIMFDSYAYSFRLITFWKILVISIYK